MRQRNTAIRWAARFVVSAILFAALSISAHAAEESSAWRITESPPIVKYAAHGTTIYGHQFGFVKNARHCDLDNLWLSWSSGKPRVKELLKSEVKFQIEVDETSFRIGVNMLLARTLAATTITIFTNFRAGSKFFDLLNQGNEVKVTIVGPPRAVGLFDIPSDSFSLVDFEKTREQVE